MTYQPKYDTFLKKCHNLFIINVYIYICIKSYIYRYIIHIIYSNDILIMDLIININNIY